MHNFFLQISWFCWWITFFAETTAHTITQFSLSTRKKKLCTKMTNQRKNNQEDKNVKLCKRYTLQKYLFIGFHSYLCIANGLSSPFFSLQLVCCSWWVGKKCCCSFLDFSLDCIWGNRWCLPLLTMWLHRSDLIGTLCTIQTKAAEHMSASMHHISPNEIIQCEVKCVHMCDVTHLTYTSILNDNN